MSHAAAGETSRIALWPKTLTGRPTSYGTDRVLERLLLGSAKPDLVRQLFGNHNVVAIAVGVIQQLAQPLALSVDFLIMPKGASRMMADFFAALDTVIFGRKTLTAAGSMRGAPKGPWTTYVFSRSLPPGERDGLVFVN